MVTAKLENTRSNAWEFVIFFTLFKTLKTRILLFSYLFCFLAIVGSGIVMYFILNEIYVLFILAAVTLTMLLCAGLLLMLMRNAAKNFYEAGGGNVQTGAMSVSIDSSLIVLRKDDKPAAFCEWSQVQEACSSNNASYIFMKKGNPFNTPTELSGSGVVIIMHDAITEGTKEELIGFIKEHNDAKM